jgi:hypothetical protein
MKNKSGKRFSGVVALVLLGVLLAVAVSFAPAATDRSVRTFSQTIERVREAACEGAAWETKVRWRLTGPGQVLPRGLVSGTNE